MKSWSSSQSTLSPRKSVKTRTNFGCKGERVAGAYFAWEYVDIGRGCRGSSALGATAHSGYWKFRMCWKAALFVDYNLENTISNSRMRWQRRYNCHLTCWRDSKSQDHYFVSRTLWMCYYQPWQSFSCTVDLLEGDVDISRRHSNGARLLIQER